LPRHDFSVRFSPCCCWRFFLIAPALLPLYFHMPLTFYCFVTHDVDATRFAATLTLMLQRMLAAAIFLRHAAERLR